VVGELNILFEKADKDKVEGEAVLKQKKAEGEAANAAASKQEKAALKQEEVALKQQAKQAKAEKEAAQAKQAAQAEKEAQAQQAQQAKQAKADKEAAQAKQAAQAKPEKADKEAVQAKQAALKPAELKQARTDWDNVSKSANDQIKGSVKRARLTAILSKSKLATEKDVNVDTVKRAFVLTTNLGNIAKARNRFEQLKKHSANFGKLDRLLELLLTSTNVEPDDPNLYNFVQLVIKAAGSTP